MHVASQFPLSIYAVQQTPDQGIVSPTVDMPMGTSRKWLYLDFDNLTINTSNHN